MKCRLEHGAELDLLTSEELEAELDRVAREYFGGPQRQWPEGSVALDASGNAGSTKIYTVPVDRTFILHRVVFLVDGATPAAPAFSAAAGYIGLMRNENLVDWVVTSTTVGLPAVLTYGSEQGPFFGPREVVEVVAGGGPTNKTVRVFLQGTLSPLAAD